jgi:hypothetical protein
MPIAVEKSAFEPINDPDDTGSAKGINVNNAVPVLFHLFDLSACGDLTPNGFVT